MNNQCINFRQRTKTKYKRKTVYFYCAKQRKEITFDDCRGCNFKEYKKCTKIVKNSAKQEKKSLKIAKTVQKTAKNSRKLHYSAKMNQKSSKLAKLERNRFSIITDDMKHCILCGNKKDHIHEVFFGRNRTNSMKYGTVVPLCSSCHARMHKDIKLQEVYHKIGQDCFNKHYPNLDFMEIFKINYL